jgi:hypothetical protein
LPASSVSAPLEGSPTSNTAGPGSSSPPLASGTTPQRGLAVTAPPAAIAPDEASAPPASAADSSPAEPSARSALSLDGPTDAKVGDEFQVTVSMSVQQPITRMRSQLRFDSSALQLISATAGGIIPAAAGSPSVDTRAGGAQMDVMATPDDPVKGTGSIMILRFKALAPRPATQIAAMLNVLGGTGGAAGSSSAPPLKIAIAR